MTIDDNIIEPNLIDQITGKCVYARPSKYEGSLDEFKLQCFYKPFCTYRKDFGNISFCQKYNKKEE